MNSVQIDQSPANGEQPVLVEVVEQRDVLSAFLCDLQRPVAPLCGMQAGEARQDHEFAVMRLDTLRLA